MTTTSESFPCALTVQSDWLDAWMIAKGHLDLSMLAGLQVAIDEVLKGAPRKVNVILSEVTFIDLAALEAIVSADERARAQGSKLVIRRPARPVRELLASSGLKDRLTISNRLALG